MIRVRGRARWISLLLLAACADGSLRTGSTGAGIYFEAMGDGPPVVLVHGFSLDSRSWDPEVAWLSATHRVVRFDLRGHGRSVPWTEPFSPVQDMLDVFDATGIERATVVGLSAGAELAVDFALAHPDRVTGLILASPGLSGYQPVGSFAWMEPVVSRLQAGDVDGAVEAWVRTPLMAIPEDAAADSLMRTVVRENRNVWTYDPTLQQRPERPAIGRLSEIDVPTLVLVGETDFVDTQRVADTLAACVVGAELVRVAGAGHLLNLQAPTRFSDALSRFLESGSRVEGGSPPAGC